MLASNRLRHDLLAKPLAKVHAKCLYVYNISGERGNRPRNTHSARCIQITPHHPHTSDRIHRAVDTLRPSEPYGALFVYPAGLLILLGRREVLINEHVAGRVLGLGTGQG